MIDVLIFSRDRPAQLDLLLTSIHRHANRLYASASCVYRATTAEYRAGYHRVWQRHKWVQPLPEAGGFNVRVRQWLEPSRSGPTISFLVDDDVFFRDATAPERLPHSYRLPWSTTWGEHDPYSDEGYPISLDGNVYEKESLLDLFARAPRYNNPTQLEAGLDAFRSAFAPPKLYSSGQSLVGIPANRVSESSGMPHMGVDQRAMNLHWLAGCGINLDATFDGVEVVAAHQDIHYRWGCDVGLSDGGGGGVSDRAHAGIAIQVDAS